MSAGRVRILDEGAGGALRVRAPFELKEDIKAFAGARWAPTLKVWVLERWHAEELVALLRYRQIPFEVLDLFGGAGTTDHAGRREATTWADAMFAVLPERLHEPAYRALVKVLHPDIGGDGRAVQVLNDAYAHRSAA